MFDLVGTSGASVALYDVSSPAILGASPTAREQLGFMDVDLADVNIVDGSSDPASTLRLCALIRDGQLKDWSVRSWLRAPDGGGCWAFATGHAIDVEGRRLGIVSYPTPDSPTSTSTGSADEADLRTAVARFAPEANGELSNRVVELEGRLHRVVRELQAAGIGTLSPRAAVLPSSPRLEGLSPRELEIVTRMLRGERVPTIARTLELSASTVRNHLSRIYQKVGVHSQVQLIETLQDAQE